MCGFTGFSYNDFELLKKISLTIKDRAIDKDYYYYNNGLSFYHAHLSISDLNKDTSQPYIYNNIVIGLVGEIYNKNYLLYLVGKEGNYTELQIIGFLYCKFGEKFINYINGEFAVFIYDIKKGEYFLFRDRWGTNLVYYILLEGNLYFSSEIKSLLLKKPSVSKEGFYDYMIFQYTISPNTIVKDIFSLEPGHYIKYKNGIINKYSFKKYKYQTHKNTLIDTLKDSIIRRIPIFQDKIFVSLSGGPDSTFIAFILSEYFHGEIIAYSLLSKNNSKEIEYAKNNAKKLGIKHLIIDIDKISKIEDIFSDFYIHEGLVNLPNILKIVKKYYPEYKDIKVSFAGDGKEELFLTNSHFPYNDIISRYKYFNMKKNIKYNITHLFLNNTLFDYNLQLYDKVSLRSGVEVRLPFTDYELLKYLNYNTYRKEITSYLNNFGLNIVKGEYGYGLGLNFKYYYDNDLLIRKNKLFKSFLKTYKKINE